MVKLRVVGPGEVASGLPRTLEDAAGCSRRDLLVRSRLQIARVIDAGVPPHALGRLISEMARIDAEVRVLDAADEQEASSRGSGQRRSFDSSAI